MKNCTSCGKEYPDAASVCAICHEPLKAFIPPAAIPTPNRQPSELPIHSEKTVENVMLFDGTYATRLKIGSLTISNEGFTFASAPPVTLLWNEITAIILSTTRENFAVQSMVISLFIYGFETPIIVLTVSASGRKSARTLRCKQLFDSLSSSWQTYRTGVSIPPVYRVWPEVAKAADALPVSIGFERKGIIWRAVIGVLMFLLLFLLPEIGIFGGGNNSAGEKVFAGVWLLPFGVVGAILAFLGFRAMDRRPKLILSAEGFSFHRGGEQMAVDRREICGVVLHGGHLLVTIKATPSRILRLKVSGLERRPGAILVMTRHLLATIWAVS